MISLIAYYLLTGLIVTFGIEHVIKWNGLDVTFGERLWSIVLWPIMTVIFVYNFVKGFLGRD